MIRWCSDIMWEKKWKQKKHKWQICYLFATVLTTQKIACLWILWEYLLEIRLNDSDQEPNKTHANFRDPIVVFCDSYLWHNKLECIPNAQTKRIKFTVSDSSLNCVPPSLSLIITYYSNTFYYLTVNYVFHFLFE